VLLRESFAGAAVAAGASAASPGEAELSAGTVTFVCTGIEGSARLWEAAPDAMARAVALHDERLRGGFGHQGGVVFVALGDGMAAAFSSPAAAVRAAVEAQRALLAAPWPDQTGVLKVRMGLHTDEAVPRNGRYAGAPVTQCARLMAAAHGGQVLLSGATEALVLPRLPDGATLIDLACSGARSGRDDAHLPARAP
jgi:class 3 adenylate cyclase